MIDSGASGSVISHDFAKRHSLPRRCKSTPVPILAVDDRPIATGLITQDVTTQLTVQNHIEMISLSIVSVSYPIILGLDWLRRHNPDIDWGRMQLTLHCCRDLGSAPTRTHALSADDVSTSRADNPSLATSSSNSWDGFGRSATSRPGADGFGRPSSPVSRLSSHCSRIRTLTPKKFLQTIRTDNAAISAFTFDPKTSTVTSELDDALHNYYDAEPDPSEWDNIRESIPLPYRSFQDTVFNPKEFDHLPPHRPYDVDIELEPGKIPPFGPLYRLSAEERDALAKHLADNLKRGHIRRSTSQCAAPVLFTRKKTGELRLCVDFRKLNAITRKNRYPLPLVNDLLDRVQGAKIFTILDLKSAYSHVRIKEGDEWKTAFRTPLGLFEHLVMPYGLTNAPAAFQSFIQDVLREHLDVFCVAYLDDILIFSRTPEEHEQHVRLILEKLRDAKLYANPRKCDWHKTSVEFLGYIIGADGVSMNPKKLSTITDWPEPETVKDVQSFLGFANFYRRFIPHFSRIVLPLTALTQKTSPFVFGQEQRNAFLELKEAFLNAPVLRHFDPLVPCTVFTDASDFALSGVLHQPDESGDLHPVAFYSRKFTPAEINYDVHDKELLAIVDTFRDMRAWVLGSPHTISVVCDHRNLEYFMASQVLNRRQARWAMFLSDYDFQLTWAPGSENVADAPSRRPDFLPQRGDDVLTGQRRIVLTARHISPLYPPVEPSADVPPAYITAALTMLSLDSSDLLDRFKTAFAADDTWREAVANGSSDFSVQQDLVFHKGRLYVPPSLRLEILRSRHDVPSAGHPGRTRTTSLVMRDYSWPGASTYVRRYCEACDTCARIKAPRHKPYGLLHPLEIPDRPWRAITFDLIVKLPLSHGYDSILVVCDRLTRAAHFIPCNESIDAPRLAQLFLDRIFRYHGLPDSIVSDRGSVFVSNFWRALCTLLQVDVKASTAFHPQTDGLTERTNQTLETYLRAYCSYQQDDWVDYLPLAEFAFNNLENASTQQTPFFANFGYHPTFEPRLAEPSTVPAAADLAARLDVIHAELRAELAHSQQRQARYYDCHALPDPDFAPGRLVWLLRRNISTTRPSDKLDHRRLGPYPIERKVAPNAYLLRLPPYLSRLYPVFHVSLLEPYADPSLFHPHAQPLPFALPDDPVLHVTNVLDCRRVGQRYDYLTEYGHCPPDEHVWIPLYDLPSDDYVHELIDRFHRRNPRAPRPHPIVFQKPATYSDVPIPLPPATSAFEPPSRNPSPPLASSPYSALDYTSPAQTTLRSGRVSKPPVRLDL